MSQETTKHGPTLAQELDELLKQQREALKSATYLQMSKGEAQKYDERQERIHELNQLLGKRKL